jgi:hypothetical protein
MLTEAIAGDWVVRAGLPILWLILNDIYKPAPTDVSVRYDGNISCFPKFCRRLTHPTGLGKDSFGVSVLLSVYVLTSLTVAIKSKK